MDVVISTSDPARGKFAYPHIWSLGMSIPSAATISVRRIRKNAKDKSLLARIQDVLPHHHKRQGRRSGSQGDDGTSAAHVPYGFKKLPTCATLRRINKNLGKIIRRTLPHFTRNIIIHTNKLFT